jgi:hypothetical protein
MFLLALETMLTGERNSPLSNGFPVKPTEALDALILYRQRHRAT